MGNYIFRLELFGSMTKPLFDHHIDFSKESFNVLMQKDMFFISIALSGMPFSGQYSNHNMHSLGLNILQS